MISLKHRLQEKKHKEGKHKQVMPAYNTIGQNYAEIDVLLHELLDGVREILGDQFVGLYLDGSLAVGDFDEDSDVDFVVITEAEVADGKVLDDTFCRLQALHDHLAIGGTYWATNLEGSYVSRRALRRHDPASLLHPNIERGTDERLKMALHNESWNVHRWVLREWGIAIIGPAPRDLIDPVTADELRHGAAATLEGWATELLAFPEQISSLGYQTYVVLTVCRVLYTLRSGTIASKPVAARWAQEALGEPFTSLIERTWFGRRNPGLAAPSEDIIATLDLIRYALEMSNTMRAN